MRVELDVKVPIDSTLSEELRKLGIETTFEIVRKSLDARKKPYYLYRIVIDLPEDAAKKLIEEGKVRKHKEIEELLVPAVLTQKSVLIVGTGPAGLFSALILAEAGFDVTVIDRGKPIQERVKDVKLFWEKRKLDKNSNVQFGEGGAGTFSDGKLTTRVKDKKKHFVYKIFVECGAPSEILYENKPHVGTDKLQEVIPNLRRKLEELGVVFRFSTKLEKLKVRNRKVEEVYLRDLRTGIESIEKFDYIFLAIGNSARDTFEMLKEEDIVLEAKPFAVGLRVIHRQRTIDRMQYGRFFKHPNLPPADYSLTYKGRERNVFSFCMCPGGYVICASSEENSVVCNGMSNYKRDSGYANSAIVVQVFPKDFENDPFRAMEFQRALERAAFVMGGSNYAMPAQKVWDFIEGQSSNKLIEGGYIPEIKSARLDKLLPKPIVDHIREAFIYWSKRIPFFVPGNATFVGVETRTSSPLRIVRGEDYSSISADNLFPIGEGAGYAGGITSSAIDGINGALLLIRRLNEGREPVSHL
ncbi:NAD(P)/FAD-dependent oxidoreductase [Desulfurobacterium thermolithotrophum]|uniref:NAD(P)/FAD-dependent oxidoreductase n=1 Tax=Desulfurobacterium thermolithotrophum TaxID=64160 RepID=UPI0013D7BE0D|nr:FAD-dependent monooxygenase [Desulfurobacterium thermolithotrophum]